MNRTSPELTFRDVDPASPAMARDVEPLIRVLRPDMSHEEFVSFATEAHGQGLVFTTAHDEQDLCVGVFTHRLLATSRGRLLFCDDLVTDPQRRSKGLGALLLAELESRARAAGCDRIELDTGTGNHGAQRFYLTNHLTIDAFHFGLPVRP